MKKIEDNELKAIQLEILKNVDIFCKAQGIKYFLAYGSAIGAIRHKGFIPWDDDIDIAMLRDDYDRFVESYNNQASSAYKVHAHNLDMRFPYPYAKIDNTHTVFEEEIKEMYTMGVNIDLFPIDKVPEDSSLQKKMFDRFTILHKLITLKRLPLKRRRGLLKNICLFIAQILLYPISFSMLVQMMEKNALKYRNINSSLCSDVVWAYGSREINKLSNWQEAIYVDFEGLKMPVPIGYDDYLSRVYGAYMQLPPKEKRITHHHYIAYWK
ncbi:MAG: LicD family protein [Prevotellaceae bacterium]|nr:LicD family protein [Candidatus Minthosoma equi]